MTTDQQRLVTSGGGGDEGGRDDNDEHKQDRFGGDGRSDAVEEGRIVGISVECGDQTEMVVGTTDAGQPDGSDFEQQDLPPLGAGQFTERVHHHHGHHEPGGSNGHERHGGKR